MKFLSAGAAIGLLCAVLMGCGNSRSKVVSGPTDLATPEERLAIETNLAEISKIMTRLGRPQSFSRFQIVVVPLERHKAHGQCVKAKDITYIRIDKGMVQEQLTGDVSWNEVNDRLFTTLLHEIGHCYFNRGHDDTILPEIPESRLLTVSAKGRRINQFHRQHVPATIMHRLGAPGHGLRDYYVAEVLGLDRAKSWRDLEKYGATIEKVTR